MLNAITLSVVAPCKFFFSLSLSTAVQNKLECFLIGYLLQDILIFVCKF